MAMPELSRFYGIVIAMFYRDHNPPHIHAYGGKSRRHPDWAAQFLIDDGSVLDGEAPDVAVRLIKDWVDLHRDELFDAWDRAVAGQVPGKVAPLRLR
jgi:hypothetical protein